MIRLATIVVVVASVFGALFGAYRLGERTAEAQYERAAAVERKRHDAAIAARDKLIAQFSRDLATAQARIVTRRERFTHVIKADPESVDWAAVRLPDGVRHALGADTEHPDGAVSTAPNAP